MLYVINSIIRFGRVNETSHKIRREYSSLKKVSSVQTKIGNTIEEKIRTHCDKN